MLGALMLGTLIEHRRLVWRHALSHLRHRYAGTGLGVVWNVLHPLAMIAVYSVVFGAIMRPPTVPGVSGPMAYVLYLCAGFLPWVALAECVTRGTAALTDNAAYLKKLPVPESVFVAQAAAAAALGLVISFGLLAVITLLAGVRPTAWWLLLPLPLLATQVMGFGVSLLLSTLNAFFRDVSQILVVALQVVMWTAPVVYLADSLPGALQAVVAWHPLTPALDATRSLLLHGRPPATTTWLALAAWPTVALLAGSLVFNRLRREIRDVL
jgi:ABC-type polysaccharide/polyol phosphate export permease